MGTPDIKADVITPAQCRAARALLDWTQARLAKEARVGLSTIKFFEGGKTAPIANNLAAIRRAFEEAGLRFTETGVETADKAG